MHVNMLQLITRFSEKFVLPSTLLSDIVLRPKSGGWEENARRINMLETYGAGAWNSKISLDFNGEQFSDCGI